MKERTRVIFAPLGIHAYIHTKLSMAAKIVVVLVCSPRLQEKPCHARQAEEDTTQG